MNNFLILTKLTARFFIPAFALLFISSFALFYIDSKANQEALTQREKHTLNVASTLLNNLFNGVAEDAQFLADSSAVQNWLSHSDPTSEHAVQQDLLAFAKYKGLYDQIRILSPLGIEMLRVNHGKSGYTIIEKNRLQNKSQRYYVREGVKLNAGEVYVSPFDLNVENKKIEQPLKPMIRFVTPIYNNDNSLKALLILNYLGQNALNELKALGDSYNTSLWLINQQGYWLSGPSPKVEWGFMYPDKMQPAFNKRYFIEWQAITQKTVGQMKTDDGLMSYRQLELNLAKRNKRIWYLVTNVDKSEFGLFAKNNLKHYTLIITALSLALLLLCYFIAKKELDRRENSLLAKNEQLRFKNLLATAPSSIIITNAVGRIVSINRAGEQEFGYPEEALLGHALNILIPELGTEKLQKLAINPSHPTSANTSNEATQCECVRQDGSSFPAEITISQLFEAGATSITLILRNISSQVAYEKNIRALNQDLRQRTISLETINKELEAFSYSVSHDLRTPLRAIDGFSLTLIEGYKDQLEEKAKDRLVRIRVAAQKMSGLIDDLLTLSRISRTELRHQPIDLHLLARESVSELQQLEPSRQLQINIEENLTTRGDKALLSIVMNNLLGNAWKFTSKNLNAVIEVGTEQRDGSTVFFVKDNGAGFDMDYSEKLFGAFQRLHDPDEFPGTGIGLATVQRIIHKHGGRIWAESELGKGASFYFTLTPTEQDST